MPRGARVQKSEKARCRVLRRRHDRQGGSIRKKTQRKPEAETRLLKRSSRYHLPKGVGEEPALGKKRKRGASHRGKTLLTRATNLGGVQKNSRNLRREPSGEKKKELKGLFVVAEIHKVHHHLGKTTMKGDYQNRSIQGERPLL